ncbi:MAG: tetratricopeptide repeat protein [bacterium]
MFIASHIASVNRAVRVIHKVGKQRKSDPLLRCTASAWVALSLLLLPNLGFSHPYALHSEQLEQSEKSTPEPSNPINPQQETQTPADLSFSKKNKDAQQASQLAAGYIEQSKQGNPDKYLPLAKKALSPWNNQSSIPANILWLRAYLYQAEHDFVRARQDLKQLLKQQPRHPLAGFSLAMLAQIQGDYKEAHQQCRQVAQAGQLVLSGLCQASVMSVNGQAEKAYRLLETFAKKVGDDLHWQQWAWTMMGDIAARLGKNEQAKQHFQQALAIPLHDAYLNMRYTDFLLAQQQPEAVLQYAVSPEQQTDQLLLRQAQAAKQLKQTHLFNRYKARLQQRINEIIAHNDDHHPALLAQYYLDIQDQPKQALKFARLNWQTQKAREDVRLLLRAALRNNDAASLQIVKQWLDTTGLQDLAIDRLLTQS